jgi:hypothetical protein
MIKQAFVHVHTVGPHVVGPHVRDGHYDLLGPTGEVIPRSAWEHVVKPGVAITMHMWPSKTHPERQVEVDKAPAGSQRDKGHPREDQWRDKGRPREDQWRRKHRKVPFSLLGL